MLDNLALEKEAEEKRLAEKRDSFEKGTQAYIDANNELLDYQQENANQQEKIDRDLGLAKEAQIKQTLGNIATIVGQNSKFGKAVAIAQAIQDTYAGADKALAQGGAFGFISAAAVVAAGLANVKKIASTKTPKPPAGLGARGGGDSGQTAPSSSPQTPAFNIVGATGSNQLAEAIAGQSQQPVRAFVVSNDVSTAQEVRQKYYRGSKYRINKIINKYVIHI